MARIKSHQQQPDSTNLVETDLAINSDPYVMEQEVITQQHAGVTDHFANLGLNIDSSLSRIKLTVESIDSPDQNPANVN